jgi:hypothetical protein
LATFSTGFAWIEADADDRVLAALGETAVRLLELGLVGDLELRIGSCLVSALNFSAPLRPPSLNDLSNLPPMSKTTAGLMSAAAAPEIPRTKPANAVSNDFMAVFPSNST